MHSVSYARFEDTVCERLAVRWSQPHGCSSLFRSLTGFGGSSPSQGWVQLSAILSFIAASARVGATRPMASNRPSILTNGEGLGMETSIEILKSCFRSLSPDRPERANGRSAIFVAFFGKEFL